MLHQTSCYHASRSARPFLVTGLLTDKRWPVYQTCTWLSRQLAGQLYVNMDMLCSMCKKLLKGFCFTADGRGPQMSLKETLDMVVRLVAVV